jgi:hypothetical protein
MEFTESGVKEGRNWFFAVCDFRPSEQMYGVPELKHIMGLIFFPSERSVKPFVGIIEAKVSEKTGKEFSMRHWKKYRNTERGKTTKGAIFKSILEAVSEDEKVILWGAIEKEKSITEKQQGYIDLFELDAFVKIDNDLFSFGPFDQIVEKDGKKTKKQAGITMKMQAGAGILWAAVNILRVYKSLDNLFISKFPDREMNLDLRVDLLPNDKINTLDRMHCFAGLLLNGSNQRISPKVNPEEKNHISDILADNIAGMFGEWDSFTQGMGLPEEYGYEQGIIYYNFV